MANPDRLPPAIRKYFYVEAHGSHWDLRCKSCPEWWRLVDTGKPVAVGNSLDLLDHAYSHVEIKKRVPLFTTARPVDLRTVRVVLESDDAQDIIEARANIASIRARAVARG